MPELKSYLQVSRTPIHSLILVAPFLLVYEIGVLALQLVLREFHVRNGADVLIHEVLRQGLGISALFVSVLVLAIGLAIWQWRSGESLRFNPRTVGLMFLESALFATALYVVPWQLYWYLTGGADAPARGSTETGSVEVSTLLKDVVLSCGAGVYEEFLFRVILVTLIAAAGMRLFKMERVRAGMVAVLLGALLFSLAHYVPPHGDPIDWTLPFWVGFVFRTVAGVYFAALYYFRCFGVAVGAHAFYDILVSVDHALRSG